MLHKMQTETHPLESFSTFSNKTGQHQSWRVQFSDCHWQDFLAFSHTFHTDETELVIYQKTVMDSIFFCISDWYMKPRSPTHKCHTGGNISQLPVSAGGNLLLSQLILQAVPVWLNITYSLEGRIVDWKYSITQQALPSVTRMWYMLESLGRRTKMIHGLIAVCITLPKF